MRSHQSRKRGYYNDDLGMLCMLNPKIVIRHKPFILRAEGVIFQRTRWN